MPSFHDARTVARSAAEMFDLVADFERYPEFAPLCLGAKIRKRWSESSGVEMLIADMEVGLGSIRAAFSTRDRLDREKGVISTANLDGPFRYFDSRWSFRDLPQGGSRIVFTTQYQFSNRALEVLFAPLFSRVAGSMTRAFEKRALETPPSAQPVP